MPWIPPMSGRARCCCCCRWRPPPSQASWPSCRSGSSGASWAASRRTWPRSPTRWLWETTRATWCCAAETRPASLPASPRCSRAWSSASRRITGAPKPTRSRPPRTPESASPWTPCRSPCSWRTSMGRSSTPTASPRTCSDFVPRKSARRCRSSMPIGSSGHPSTYFTAHPRTRTKSWRTSRPCIPWTSRWATPRSASF